MATVFYIGDSTVTFNRIGSYPQQGMSNVLPLFLKDGICMSPHGHNGRSTKSFQDEGLWEPVQNSMKAGDFLLIQFGHNDEKADPPRHTDPDTTFKDNLRLFIRTAQEKGAYPILHTPIGRRLFDEAGNFRPGSHGEYPRAIREVGAELGVPVIDLTAMTEQFLAETGDEATRTLFVWPVDNTHLKFQGAVTMMRFWAEEMEKLGSPYADILASLENRMDKRGEI
jgi:lysophospholipase L1-like esterase